MNSAAAVLKPIHLVRKKNLVTLVEKKFSGNASECARAIKRSHTYMWQLVQGYRGIGEGSARHIEKMLDLVPMTLDAKKDERTTRLQASDGQGNVQSYAMVPLLKLDDLAAKPKTFVPCPTPGCSKKTFAVQIEDEDVVELQPGDRVFVDPDDTEPPISRKLYVVKPKARGAACILMARKRASNWMYGATGDRARIEFSFHDVRVVGRVMMILRELPK